VNCARINWNFSSTIGSSLAPFSLTGRRGLLVARGVLLFGNSTSGAHNIREHSRARSRLVFPERFPCGKRDRSRSSACKNAHGWDPFLVSLFAVGAGRKISITPIYYPSVRGRATKSRAYAARAHNTGPFTSGPMRTESAVSLKINLSIARIIACMPRHLDGHATLANARVWYSTCFSVNNRHSRTRRVIILEIGEFLEKNKIIYNFIADPKNWVEELALLENITFI